MKNLGNDSMPLMVSTLSVALEKGNEADSVFLQKKGCILPKQYLVVILPAFAGSYSGMTSSEEVKGSRWRVDSISEHILPLLTAVKWASQDGQRVFHPSSRDNSLIEDPKETSSKPIFHPK